MQMVFPDDWDGESFCRWAICWPDSIKWRAILSGLIEQPSQGRFWDFKTGNFLETRALFFPAYGYNFELKEVIVACGDSGLQDIANALLALAQSQQNIANATVITSGGCCDNRGSGGSGTTGVPYSPVETGSPGIGTPPEGWDTWEEYLADKCAVATYIVNMMARDLGDLALRELFSLKLEVLASIIAVTIATPIPFDDIIAIAAFILAIGEIIVITSAVDIINNNKPELICELYSGENATDSRDRFLTLFGTLAEDYAGNPVTAFAISTLVSYWLGADSVNRLYNRDTTFNYPPGDCSTCGAMIVWDNCAGEPLEHGAELTFTLSSTPDCGNSYGCHTIWLNFNTDTIGVMYSSPRWIVTAWDATGFTGGCYTYLGNPADFLFYDHTGGLLGYGIDPMAQDFNQFFALSSTPFTVTFTVEVSTEEE